MRYRLGRRRSSGCHLCEPDQRLGSEFHDHAPDREPGQSMERFPSAAENSPARHVIDHNKAAASVRAAECQ